MVDAVLGLGEALVSGLETPDHYVVDRGGDLVRADLVGARAILDAASLHKLLAERHGR